VRVLVVGATGFIGAEVTAALAADGNEIVAVTRRGRFPPLVGAKRLILDLARATDATDWLPHLAGVDAVVNCAGVLQDGPGDSTAAVHVRGVLALIEACERAGVRRVVHVSAIGVDRETPTAFSRTKLAGDQALAARDLDWVILRPSVVVGRSAYGGSALLRGLAALSLLPVVGGTGPLQIVHLDDLVATIRFFLHPDAPSRLILEIVGPRQWRFEDVVGLFRRWLGWSRARTFRIPSAAGALLFRLGDAVSLLGWRPPVRSTAGREIMRGASGDPGPWTQLTGLCPRDLEAALAAEPPSVQERWFAALYLLKPLVLGALSLFFALSGLISLGPGFAAASSLMQEAGAGPLAGFGIVAGALADIVIGIGIAVRPTARPALRAALAISVFYGVVGTVLVPQLWTDPLAPLLKIVPLGALNLVALAILDDR